MTLNAQKKGNSDAQNIPTVRGEYPPSVRLVDSLLRFGPSLTNCGCTTVAKDTMTRALPPPPLLTE